MRAMPSSSWTPCSSISRCRWFERLVDADGVFALHAVARMEHALRPIAVVGQQDQTFRVAIEPAHGEEALGRRPKLARHEVDDRSLGVAVADRARNAGRLGQRKVEAPTGTRDRLAVDREHVPRRVDELADAGR